MYTQTAWQAAEARFAEMRDVTIVVPHLKKSKNEACDGVFPDTQYSARYLLECGWAGAVLLAVGQPETQVFTDTQINAATRDFVERVCPAALTSNYKHVQWETYREIIRRKLTNHEGEY